jgi:2-dehydro-3-deoxyphosphooctonate aldolase (KDO 8-P synthase)
MTAEGIDKAQAIKVGEGARRAVFGNCLPLTLIAGPCALESRSQGLETAHALAEIASRLGVGLVFKASFDKANRTSGAAPRGVGFEAALPIFAEIRQTTGLPVTTDVHEPWQCEAVAIIADILQIPAFLCRQTDLIVAAARTARVVNIKKGQFLAPWDMRFAVEKVRAAGNERVLVTERGASFGYNALVSDMRALPILKETTRAPVIFDSTHSAQQPGGAGASSGGERRFIHVLARAAVSIGVAGLLVETHRNPDAAVSDSATQIPLSELSALIEELLSFDRLAKSMIVQPRPR